MPTLVVPFRDVEGKSRLAPLDSPTRAQLALAMLGDVVAAAAAVGTTFVVAARCPELAVDGTTAPPFTWVSDPGGGQGRAVEAGLDAAAIAGAAGPFLIVNADLPCASPRDLLALAGAVPEVGIALTPAADGTTNAIGLSSTSLFKPLYGPGSADRFAATATSHVLDVPNLRDDVDTVADLHRLAGRLGPRTQQVLAAADAPRVKTAR